MLLIQFAVFGFGNVATNASFYKTSFMLRLKHACMMARAAIVFLSSFCTRIVLCSICVAVVLPMMLQQNHVAWLICNFISFTVIELFLCF